MAVRGRRPELGAGDDPPGDGWELIVQLDTDSLPLYVDFGDGGVGYAFVAPDRLEGRFLWQCS